MNKSELLARIKALEKRCAALEARPIYCPPPSIFSPSPGVLPVLAPAWVWPTLPVVTCGNSFVADASTPFTNLAAGGVTQ